MVRAIRADAEKRAYEARLRDARNASTVQDAAEAWITCRQQKRGLRASTEREYRSIVRAHILSAEAFDKPVVEITRGNVLAWRDELDARRDRFGKQICPMKCVWSW